MRIQPVVVGTAGHIDHGKSSLVRALTGIDPDRLKEERERGLTIDLGFARFELPGGALVGMVDVPGHERFVRNMVAGASGIDLALLVVAADDGVMPQTREHLDIMGLLGVRRGLVALNKVDAVDADLVELAAEDVREAVRGTFLEGAPVVPVSAVRGDGLEELRAALAALAAEAEPRAAEGVFRMPVQRVFSARGFGTILTGIPVSGRVAVGDALEVVGGRRAGPLRAPARVRGIQAYHEATDEARAGHSTALNLSDVDHHAVRRGDVVCARDFFAPVGMVGARLTVLPAAPLPVRNRLPIRLHTGTADLPGEVVLLDSDELAPGESGLVQLRLDEPVVCAPGDRFVLRLASPAVTLGGGVILEESRYRLKRFKGFVLEELAHQETSLDDPARLLESVLARRGAELVPTAELAVAVKRAPAATRELLAGLAAEGRVSAPAAGERWIHADRLEEALLKLRAAVTAWFEEHPERGVVETLELRRRTGFEPAFLSALVAAEVARGGLVQEPGGQLRLPGREVELDQATAARHAAVLELLVAAGLRPPEPAELAAALGEPEDDVRRALSSLEDRGEVRRIGGDVHVATDALARAERAIVANCERNGELVIPELRDELDTTRKWLIPLLEHFDAVGVTLRQGGRRVLRRA